MPPERGLLPRSGGITRHPPYVLIRRPFPRHHTTAARRRPCIWTAGELGKCTSIERFFGRVRDTLCADGGFPSRRTFERRLNAVAARLPEQITAGGQHLLERLTPWAAGGRAVAIDSTPLHARWCLA